MKRSISFLLILFYILGLGLSAFALSGDNTDEDATEHEHVPAAPMQENLVEATCEVDGSYDSVIYCSVCKRELSSTPQIINKTGHKAGSVLKENEINATCTTDGSYDEVIYCTVCHAQISRKTVVVPSPGHSWDEGTVTKEPTCKNVGEKVYTCSVCHINKYVEIPFVDHSYKDGVCIWCNEKQPAPPTTPPTAPPTPPTTPPGPPSPPPKPPLRLTVYSTTNGEVHTGYDIVPNGRTYIINPGASVTFTFHPYNQYYVYDVIFYGKYYGSINACTINYDMMDGKNRTLNVKFASIYASPKTGDDANLGLWTALGIISLTFIGFALTRRKEK